MTQDDRLQELVAEVAAAYFSNAQVPPADIPRVVQKIAASLAAVKAPPDTLTASADPVAVLGPRMHPARVKKLIRPDALISFENNRRYKTLRPHLTAIGLTPEQYRLKWGLPADYPMVCASYSEARSTMAKGFGLGRKPSSSGKPGRHRGRPG